MDQRITSLVSGIFASAISSSRFFASINISVSISSSKGKVVLWALFSGVRGAGPDDYDNEDGSSIYGCKES